MLLYSQLVRINLSCDFSSPSCLHQLGWLQNVTLLNSKYRAPYKGSRSMGATRKGS